MNRLIWLGLVAFVIRSGPSALAAAPPPPQEPANMTMSQLQGLACLGTGLFGAMVAYAYTDMLVLTGAVVVNPVAIFAPVVVTGFAFGCNIGSSVAPGLFWLHARLQ